MSELEMVRLITEVGTILGGAALALRWLGARILSMHNDVRSLRAAQQSDTTSLRTAIDGIVRRLDTLNGSVQHQGERIATLEGQQRARERNQEP